MIVRTGAALTLFAMPLQMSVALAATPAEQIAQLPLEQMCNASGALGISFGSTEHELAKLYGASRINRKLTAEFSPFTLATIEVSRYSRRFGSVLYRAKIATEAEALNARKAFINRLIDAGWVPWADAIDGRTASAGAKFAANFEDEALWYNGPTNGLDKDEGASLFIRYSIDGLIVECMGEAEADALRDEAQGKVPVGMAKPVFTPAENMMRWTPADCDDPAKRAEFQEALDRHNDLDLFFGANREYFEEHLAAWKMMKLTSSGKIEHSQLDDQITKIVSDILKAKVSDEMVEHVDNVKDAVEALENVNFNDEADICRGLMKMITQVGKTLVPKPGVAGDANIPIWRRINEFLDREAERLGVSFED
jgi:hypothetical protein